MPNPLDDAFAKAEAARAAEAHMEREKERAAEQAARDLLEGYREVLAAVPRHVTAAPETMTLAWSPGIEPPSSVSPAGVGQDHRGSSLEFGTCDAWRFTRSNPEHKTRTEFFIATDCATVFMIKSLSGVRLKRRLRRAVSAELLEAFADVRTGRHDLHRCRLPRPESIAEMIAAQELARRR